MLYTVSRLIAPHQRAVTPTPESPIRSWVDPREMHEVGAKMTKGWWPESKGGASCLGLLPAVLQKATSFTKSFFTAQSHLKGQRCPMGPDSSFFTFFLSDWMRKIAILACLSSQRMGLAFLDSSSEWALASKMPRDEARLCCAYVQRISFLVGPIKQSSTDQTPGWLLAIKL